MANSTAISPEIRQELKLINQSISELRAEIRSRSQAPTKQYYRPAEVCEILGISRTKFETFKNAGSFTIRKVGGSVYVAAADLEKFLPKPK